jgi:hypothetical protein
MKMPSIKPNVCTIDRIIRGGISLALILFGVLYWGTIGDAILQIIILTFAGLNLMSTAIGWCPVYKLANITTCKSEPV